jgi:hypothetical protein
VLRSDNNCVRAAVRIAMIRATGDLVGLGHRTTWATGLSTSLFFGEHGQ